MDHPDVPQLLGTLVIVLGSAKVAGALAKRFGQPAVLGELIAGVVLGASVLGLVDTQSGILHFLAELGIIILLFEIGLETELGKLIRVGGTSTAVALAGVVLPFAGGYAVCRLLGLDNLVAIVAGATLTATSVGITARVLADLGRLQEPEGQIVLGAAVVDDILGLVVLAVVGRLTEGRAVTAAGVVQIAAVAFGFLIVTLVMGSWLVPPLVRWFSRSGLPGALVTLGLVLAFGLAWMASAVGSALIIGAFAAGLLLRTTPQATEIEKAIAPLGHFFVPIFFVLTGAFVDVRVFNPFDPGNRATWWVGGLLIVVAVLGKFLAGYAPFWFRGNKMVVGVGMIPRGEVGLIFAQMGLASGVFSRGLFSAVTLMVMITTFLAPPLLRLLFRPVAGRGTSRPPEGVQDLVGEP
jgi:Kef-type K+ transport system membrane component KefB